MYVYYIFVFIVQFHHELFTYTLNLSSLSMASSILFLVFLLYFLSVICSYYALQCISFIGFMLFGNMLLINVYDVITVSVSSFSIAPGVVV